MTKVIYFNGFLNLVLVWKGSANGGDCLHDPNGFNTPVMSIPAPIRPPTRRRPIKAPTGAAAFVNRTEIRVELCCWKRTACSRMSLPLHTNPAMPFARSNAPFAFLNENNNLFLSFPRFVTLKLY